MGKDNKHAIKHQHQINDDKDKVRIGNCGLPGAIRFGRLQPQEELTGLERQPVVDSSSDSVRLHAVPYYAGQ